MSQIIEDKCECGEPTLVEINAPIERSARRDRKRPHYEDSSPYMMVFRCRGCGEPVDTTVPSAKFED